LTWVPVFALTRGTGMTADYFYLIYLKEATQNKNSRHSGAGRRPDTGTQVTAERRAMRAPAKCE
jgi:hypothetical protein